MISSLSAHLFGGHVANRPEDGSRCCVPGASRQHRRARSRRHGFQQLRQTEVEDLHAAIGRHKQILRFEIPMDDALVMGCGKAADDLNPVCHGRPRRQRSVSECLAKRLTVK